MNVLKRLVRFQVSNLYHKRVGTVVLAAYEELRHDNGVIGSPAQ